ncbi:MAG: hypothetical protein VW437_09665, partial [Betaproteobacteria bacterium]
YSSAFKFLTGMSFLSGRWVVETRSTGIAANDPSAGIAVWVRVLDATQGFPPFTLREVRYA